MGVGNERQRAETRVRMRSSLVGQAWRDYQAATDAYLRMSDAALEAKYAEVFVPPCGSGRGDASERDVALYRMALGCGWAACVQHGIDFARKGALPEQQAAEACAKALSVLQQEATPVAVGERLMRAGISAGGLACPSGVPGTIEFREALRQALWSADWSGVPIGNKVLVSLATELLATPSASMIPVSERMPDPGEHARVLVFTEGHDFGGQQFFDVLAEDLNENYWDGDQPEHLRLATHWCPRPHPVAPVAEGDKE